MPLSDLKKRFLGSIRSHFIELSFESRVKGNLALCRTFGADLRTSMRAWAASNRIPLAVVGQFADVKERLGWLVA